MRQKRVHTDLIVIKKRSFRQVMQRYAPFYLFLLPAIIWYGVFHYYPMAGIQIAFKNFQYSKGIFGSDWIGLLYFEEFLRDPHFFNIVRNTLVISFANLVFAFPMPVILALMLNAVRVNAYKRTIQTVSYLPHFVSWVVVAALIHKFFSPTMGMINDLRIERGLDAIYFLGKREYFLQFVVVSHIWKSVGYGSIIYLAALAGIDPTLYEAANIDGANGFRKLLHITMPGIKPTVGIMFLLSLGGILGANMEQILLLQTPATFEVSEVIDTYVLNRGLNMNQFEYATAIGLFRSVVTLILVITVNYTSKKLTDISLW